MGKNIITDKGGVELIKSLLKCRSIEYLNISDNKLGEISGKILELLFMKIKRSVIVMFNGNIISSIQTVKINK